MKIRILPLPFYVGLSVLSIGTLFKLGHWPGWQYMLICGTTQETIFTALTIAEIITSKKANKFKKALWGLSYGALPALAFFNLRWELFLLAVFLCGMFYLNFGRKKFIHHKEKVRQVQYDSMEI